MSVCWGSSSWGRTSTGRGAEPPLQDLVRVGPGHRAHGIEAHAEPGCVTKIGHELEIVVRLPGQVERTEIEVEVAEPVPELALEVGAGLLGVDSLEYRHS